MHCTRRSVAALEASTFVSDVLRTGGGLVLLNVSMITRASAYHWSADTSLSGARVARELDRCIRLYGRPKPVVSDTGTELTRRRAILECRTQTGHR